jgi:hypothetical protein
MTPEEELKYFKCINCGKNKLEFKAVAGKRNIFPVCSVCKCKQTMYPGYDGHEALNHLRNMSCFAYDWEMGRMEGCER